jgi:ABC-type multidrug transport system fused ATPase/permease subunit
MEAPQYSGEIDIDGVVMQGTLPALLRWRIGTINIESQLFNIKNCRWQIGMIIYENKEN